MEISGNTVLITGGATGIGYAMAESVLEARNDVIICGRRKVRLLEAQKKHRDFHIKVCNVAEEADRRTLCDRNGRRIICGSVFAGDGHGTQKGQHYKGFIVFHSSRWWRCRKLTNDPKKLNILNPSFIMK